MLFGVCSAPEVWQRTMHESVEDLEGVEVIADDFLIAGFGIGDREVNNNLKKTWAHFSQEMPLVEPEIESCQNETAPVKHEIYGSATHLLLWYCNFHALCWISFARAARLIIYSVSFCTFEALDRD